MIFHGHFIKHHNRILHLLQICTRTPSLSTTKPLHALSITLGPNPTQPTYLPNNIISLYTSLNELRLARKVFDKMPERTIVSYNSIISSYCKNGCLEEALGVFFRMRGCGFCLNNFALAGLLSCPRMDISIGVQLMALAIKYGLLDSDAYVGTALIGVFGRRGWLREAFDVFEGMPVKSLVTLNSMISLFGHHGYVKDCMLLFCELVGEVNCLSEGSFIGVLSGLVCEEDLVFVEQVHNLVIKSGFSYTVSVVNSLIGVYGKCAGLYQAEKMFQEAEDCRDIVTWNTMIGALAKSERPVKALEFFYKMSKDGILPNQTTFVSLISSCANLQIRMYGEFVHAKVVMNGLDNDVYLGSALIDYYAKCDKLDDARCCFVSIHEKNVVSWNSLILGYADKCSSVAISLLMEMIQSGYRPNEFSFSALLKSSSALGLLQLHCLIIRMGYENNEYVESSLISSYGRNGLVSDALVFIAASEIPLSNVHSNTIAGIYNRSGQYYKTLKLLSELEEPDSVSWNIAIAACARNVNYEQVFELFKYMLVAQIRPDNYTYISILSSCSQIADLALGSCIHGFLIKNNFKSCDTFVSNILIDMYGKCGCPGSSLKVFDSVTDKNLITWTALISSLGINGYAHEALEKFKNMENLGIRPDKVAFIAVLTACRHGALVREGMDLFEKMKSYGIAPQLDHYHSLVDLLVRYGYVKEAEKVISSMPFPPNALIWRTLLEGCQRYRNKEDQVVGM
ncbi:pentatricopeptide repeat-containing protein At3g58590 [Mercurialis annua]|uniref:pentatricopeptide repeat-containing protein At3g58590 n=1 Tax=Mercurialis annua TaxID=3986 RepID=UPI0021604A69|nr:pentatricopeptide repeat-containing protein At3g58590 [Mercurialis annua]